MTETNSLESSSILAPWRAALTGSLHRNRSLVYSRYAQLATVRSSHEDGRCLPANRTVVFRGFLDDGNQLKFITDDRSEKVAQIEQQPWGELCWYFPKTREQFRLLGTLTIVREDCGNCTLEQTRQTQWQELSDAARVQFAWAASGQLRTAESDFNPIPPDAVAPPPNFCLLLLDPVQVDHLLLRGNPQNRFIYQKVDQLWKKEEVNP
ncbi:Npun_F5749 family FMN-dependent PPOX-type flavoprotein [Leptolyngbya ohadii]|uniref:Npun_F5749 family FMN-dependent PPOX-type flavoprotein n=1 Tax=Leptolyngbya ohadii TaxID=1962290 RepID=UPI0019D4B9B8|nr:Npun_F5749 family FMN-dependent PPOX-type flavoprotein [Leptolyngbya ohadii]